MGNIKLSRNIIVLIAKEERAVNWLSINKTQCNQTNNEKLRGWIYKL